MFLVIPYSVGGFPFGLGGWIHPVGRRDCFAPPPSCKGKGKEGSLMSIMEFVAIVGLMGPACMIHLVLPGNAPPDLHE